MEYMSEIIIVVLMLNSFGLAYLIYKNLNPSIRYEYFWDGINEKNWVYNKKELNIKAQLYINNTPVGLPQVICTYKEKELDTERIEWLVKEVLVPVGNVTAQIMMAKGGNPIPLAKRVIEGFKIKN